MLDHLITGGTIVDGTGSAGFVGDVGVRDGRIVAVGPVGSIAEAATETFDATGLVVAPGFVDPHTHYDAQLMWDPFATPSNVHGVTSMVGGNCGFTLAPLHAEDADYTRRMMAKVEGMALPALEQGVDWSWETFAEYLDRLEGTIAINSGFMVGHCALRRYVMGADATAGEATPEQVEAMVAELRTAIEVGGFGFSTTLSSTHSDGDGVPVASRHASVDELVALSAEVGRHEGTSLEAAFTGGLDQFFDDEIEIIAKMTGAAKRTLNWNVLTVDSKVPARIPRQLGAADRGRGGGRPRHGADHAGARADEHELRHVLLVQPDAGLGRDPRSADPRAGRQVAGPRGARRDGRALALRGGRRVPPPRRLGQLRHRRHVLRGQRGPFGQAGVRARGRVGHRQLRRAGATSPSTTTCAPSSGPAHPTTTPSRGSCGGRCGTTPGP